MSEQSTKVPSRLLYVGNTHEAFLHGLIAQVQQLGFDRCGYLVGIPSQGKKLQFVMVNTYPKPWQDRYLQNSYFNIDPTIEHAKSSTSPLTWSPALFERDQTTDLSIDAKDFGFNHGWTQSIRESNGRFGAFTVVRSDGEITEDELTAKLPILQWLALVVHGMLFRTLRSRHQNELATPLTEREIEMLHLAAAGKTSAEMAKLVNLAERTVNFHMGNVMKKLGAENKTQAAVLAVQMGLLE